MAYKGVKCRGCGHVETWPGRCCTECGNVVRSYIKAHPRICKGAHYNYHMKLRFHYCPHCGKYVWW